MQSVARGARDAVKDRGVRAAVLLEVRPDARVRALPPEHVQGVPHRGRRLDARVALSFHHALSTRESI